MRYTSLLELYQRQKLSHAPEIIQTRHTMSARQPCHRPFPARQRPGEREMRSSILPRLLPCQRPPVGSRSISATRFAYFKDAVCASIPRGSYGSALDCDAMHDPGNAAEAVGPTVEASGGHCTGPLSMSSDLQPRQACWVDNRGRPRRCTKRGFSRVVGSRTGP